MRFSYLVVFAALILTGAVVFLIAPGCVSGGDAKPYETPDVYGDDDDAGADEDQVLATASELADAWTGYHDAASLAWSWDAAVLMMGLWDLARLTGDETYSDYVLDWLDHHIDIGYTIASSDTSVPGYVALLAWHATGDERYLAVADDVWDYIENKAGRTSDGGLNHLGWISGNELWIDSLFMLGPFLMDYAEVIADDAPAREYAKQLNVFRTHLRDDETGLYRHRYDDDTGEVAPALLLFWGRGNGWVFAAENMAAKRLSAAAKVDLDFDLESDLAAMRASIEEFTPDDGRFHTLVNEPISYQETSAGLLFAYGLATAVRDGRADHDAAIVWIERWIAGAMREIAEDAAQDTLLLGVSYGTSPGDLEYYNQVMKGENVSYGIGAFLLAAVAREDIGPARALARPAVRKDDETWVDHPIPCAGAACGKFHLARGNFNRAKSSFADALAANPADAEALFYDALVDVIRVGVGVVQQLDRKYVGEIDTDGVIAWLADQRPVLQSVSARLAGTEANPEYTSYLDRLLIIESGGHNAVGAREYDLGEAYLVDGIAHVLSGGLALLGGGEKRFAMPHGVSELTAMIGAAHRAFAERASKSAADDAIDEIIAGIDDVIAGINAIMAEIDDQSDDLIPKNLLKLEGSFGIPGILQETDVKDLVAGLGLPAGLLENLDMPEALIDLLETIRAVLEAVKLIV